MHIVVQKAGTLLDKGIGLHTRLALLFEQMIESGKQFQRIFHLRGLFHEYFIVAESLQDICRNHIFIHPSHPSLHLLQQFFLTKRMEVRHPVHEHHIGGIEHIGYCSEGNAHVQTEIHAYCHDECLPVGDCLKLGQPADIWHAKIECGLAEALARDFTQYPVEELEYREIGFF